MNGGRSDASTSTDDITSRPLCLFYFTHPFGVLSAEPPTLAAAPPHIARAFLNMEPVSPWTLWSPAPPPAHPAPPPAEPSDDDYNTDSSAVASRPSYELGNATVHRTPLSLVSVTRTRKCTLDFGNGRDSISSSLFSSDMWINSSSSCRSNEYPRRLVPYKKILPPLQLPSPKDSSNLSSSDDFWPKKCLNPEKFSLPPIEMPSMQVNIVRSGKCSMSSEETCSEGAALRSVRARRRLGVSKPRRARAADLRRLLATLMRRALAGGAERDVSPALGDALNTIREAWAEPRSLLSRCRLMRVAPAARAQPPALMECAAAAELPPRAGASPGLLRRRYSVPETIMRKYRLAQQRSDSEESAPATNRSVASASPPQNASGSPADTPHRYARRDRELMRKSALMRRMWGRPCEPGRSCCCCGAEPCDPALYGGRETRSLDGSRSELRPQSSGLASSRYSHAAAGWATPKRQRLDSSQDFRGSDDMLRAAMKNSYDRAEETRNDHATRADFSDSTYRSNEHNPTSSYTEMVTDTFTDSDGYKFDITGEGNASTQYSERQSSDTATIETKSITTDDVNVTSENFAPFALSDDRSLSDSSETYSASYPTAKESGLAGVQPTRSALITGRVSERSGSLHRDDNDALPYGKPLSIHTPSYEVLEIVVSETLNVSSVPAISSHAQPPNKTPHSLRAPKLSHECAHNINIDEYVSNILVESLNSLTDQLECMNASMGSDRKMSIVEKEIKVKLQNTGVNTIVHLSPTSNNQIIFGNEELCINEERKDYCNKPLDAQDAHDALAIRDEAHSVESNNNLTSAGSPSACPCDSFDLQHDSVNQAVLQQIQKLFQDELHNLDPDMEYSDKVMPEISHIEISNVTDVFIDNENEPGPMGADSEQVRGTEYELISGVGTGSYYLDVDDQPVVPRFSAFPHTDSMEVNTSSSDDADPMGSDCTSLVDSLDDPNSPRSVLLRRAFTGRRSELVRSAIDVLDLLPENARNEEVITPKDRGESFFIQIKDNECDCDKENVNVADRMPEKIKQRLYRRHRKREMRMECARRTRGKQRSRDVQSERRHDEHCRSRRDVERDCVAIVNALIDDVINKIAQEEYKCMRIKRRPSKMVTSKSDDNVSKQTWKKELEPIDDRDHPFKSLKNNSARYDSFSSGKHKGKRHQLHGKLSFVTRPTAASDDRAAKRIYQKSEIHDGNKCIEILEILEYVNGSQSSPETTTSDENQNHSLKNKKSRIPIPIYEKNQRSPNNELNKSNNKRSSVRAERNGNTDRLIADMLLGALVEPAPHPEPRSRSNSLRFKQTFDIIPEERSSLSLDSGNEDFNHNRRASAPDIADQFRESTDAECNDAPFASPPHKLKPRPDSRRRCRDMKSAGTSPILDSDGDKRALRSKNQTTMTSPGSKSAATSPMRAVEGGAGAEAGLASRQGRARPGYARPDAHASLDEGYKERVEFDKVRPRRSVINQFERTQDTRSRVDCGYRRESGHTELIERGARRERGRTERSKRTECGARSEPGRSERSERIEHGSRPEPGRTKRSERIEHGARPEPGRTERSERIEHGARPEPGRTERSERIEHGARPEPGRTERSERIEHGARPEPGRTERSERIEHGARPEPGRTERSERIEHGARTERAKRPARPDPRLLPRARCPSTERGTAQLTNEPSDRSPDDIAHIIGDKQKSRSLSLEISDEDGSHATSVKHGGDSDGAMSSDNSESGGSLLCSLAPKWLSQGRARRAARRRSQDKPASPAPRDPLAADPAQPDQQPPGGWSVTVAGSCRATLPADVEMRLRFPHDSHAPADGPCQECTCRHCATCACSARVAQGAGGRWGAGRGAPHPLPPAAAPPSLARLARTDSSKLTLTMKKEALDSSILASKSSKKFGEPLPDVETYRASRSKLKSSVKTRRGCSLHCWLPDDEAAPIRPSNGLSVLGSAIIPELKPRVPTMSERDLTRVYTPRHYLRS